MPDWADASDSQLMEATAGGDRDAFTVLIGRHQGRVLSVACRFLADRSGAEDAAQEVFLRLWRSARRYRPDAPLAAYLRTLTVNLCLDAKRKARFVVLGQEGEPPGRQDPHGEMVARERAEALSAALQRLPPAQRMAAVLFHMEGVSVKELASLLEVSPKAAESLLSRARSSLRERLRPQLTGS